MKMQQTDLEFVVFDARDIIMTSGNDDDMLTMIWLSNTSIDNFNALVPSGGYILDKGYFSKYAWIAYSGEVVPPDEPEFYYPVGHQNETPSSGIYTVRAGNTKDYEAVLEWLGKHSSQ